MTKSKGSVVVGGERSQHGLAAVVVVPDGGGEREESLKHPGEHALLAMAAVVFEAELAFEGRVDRFDDLAERLEKSGSWSWFLVAARGTDEFDAVFGQSCLELGAGVALVRDDRLAVTAGEQTVIALEEVDGDVAFVDLGVRQREGDRQPGRGAHQMQT